MALDPWHFPRLDLAASTLSVLAKGPAQALTLFAPRRTGKTEFLLQDLGPLAEKRGHRVIYASFWQAPLSPLAVLLYALEESRRSGTLADRARNAAATLTPKLTLSAGVSGSGAKAEIDLTKLKGEPPADLLLYLDQILGRLVNKKRPTLLLLDEVQELARDPNHRPLVAALRTSLDTKKNGLAAVFTGSSREGLKAMFNSSEAPFFHFATPIDLPPLDQDFVDHMRAIFARMTRRTIPKNDAAQAFEALHRNPAFFRGLIEMMVLNADLDITTALKQFRERLARELGYPQIWLQLSPLQRATALILARGTQKPFGRQARETVGIATGEAAPSIARIQAAIRKLENLSLADRWTGQWVLEDPEFAAWVIARTKDGI